MADDIGSWLEAGGLGQYVDAFIEKAVDLDLLPHLYRDATLILQCFLELAHTHKYKLTSCRRTRGIVFYHEPSRHNAFRGCCYRLQPYIRVVETGRQ